MVSCSVTYSSKQEFDVSVSAGDRRFDRSQDTPTERCDKFLDVAADRGVHGMVSDNALFRRGATGLELRLDQRNKPCRSFGERERRRQQVPERYKADVDGDKIRRFVEQVRGQRADIGSLEQSNVGSLTQGFMQLGTTDVYGVDAPCPALKQELCKPAGRRTDIQADTPFWVKCEMVEGGGKLNAASRDVWVRRTGTKNRVGCQFLGCFSYRPVVGEYKPGFNRGLGLGAAFEWSALDEQAVNALARRAHGASLSKPQDLGSGTMVHPRQLAVLGGKHCRGRMYSQRGDSVWHVNIQEARQGMSN